MDLSNIANHASIVCVCVCVREREREREREYLAHWAKNHRETQRKRQTDRHIYTCFAASRVQIPWVSSYEEHEL